jgi:hypothetical protein
MMTKKVAIGSALLDPRKRNLIINGEMNGNGDPWVDIGVDQMWTITGGAARYPSGGTPTTTNILRQACGLGPSLGFLSGQLFELTYTFIGSGGVLEFNGILDGWIPLGAGVNQTIQFHGNGSYEFAEFKADATVYVGNLDTVSIKAVGSVGPELVADGEFQNWNSPTDLTQWTENIIGAGSITQDANGVRFQAGSGDTASITNLGASLQIGKTYRIVVDIYSITSGIVSIRQGGSPQIITYNTGGLKILDHVATATNRISIWRGSTTNDFIVKSISVREVLS